MLFWAIIWATIMVGGEIDIFVPSFPEIQHAFSLSPFYVELVLTLNLVAYGLASFWAGSWGDRYGYKNVTIAGLIVFVVGSFICWLAPTLGTLLVGRMVQGAGIAAPSVLAYVWIMEVYPKDRHIFLTGAINGIVTLATAGAPILGSFITLWWGWRGNFAVLLIGGVIAWGLCQLCPSPSKTVKENTPMGQVSYRDIWNNKFAVYTMAANSTMVLLYYVFVGISPILFREGLGVSLEDYGWYQGSLCFVFALFSLLSDTFVKRWGKAACMQASLVCLLAFCVGLVWLVVCDERSALVITLVMSVFAGACAIPSVILYPLGLNAIPEAKGKISAVQVASRLGLTAVGLQVAGYIYDGTFVPIGILLFAIMLSVFFCIGRLYQRYGLSELLRD